MIKRFLLPAAQWLAVLMPASILVGNAGIDVVCSLIAVCFLLHSVMEKDWAWLRSRWVQIALVLWLYMLARSLFAEHADEALSRSAPWIRFPLAAVALGFWVLNDGRTRQRLFIVLSAVVIFMLGDTWLQYATGRDILGHDTVFTSNTTRLTGPLSGPKIGIVLIWLSFPVLLGGMVMAARRYGLRALVLGGVMMAVLVGTIFITGERMAFLLAVLGVGLAALLLKRYRMAMIGGGVAIIIALAGLMLHNSELFERQYRSTVDTLDHFWELPYGMIWSSAFHMIEDHPVFGVGPRHFRSACANPAYGPMDNLAWRCNLHPHNMYLEWLTETGLVGFALFLALIVFWARDAWRTYPLLQENPVYLGLLITLLLRLFPLASATGFFTGWSAMPFWLALGWLYAVMRFPQDEPSRGV